MESLTSKWLKRWKESKAFEAVPSPGQKKFFLTFPYPYVNGYLHVGHFYSSMRVEAFARYKRMQGFNVLYPQGWHCTGSPIENAANRIKEGEPKQIKILKDMGFSDEQVQRFADPYEWIRYFPIEAKKDLEAMGYSIDFRRQFITTSMNPHYDRFIRWQFRKLKEKGYVIKGKFPVVWCPKENCPIGDHSRLEGEGETPQEFMLVKHRHGDMYLVTATLRQDTILGITNLYVHPDLTYDVLNVDGEKWVASPSAAEKLKQLDHKVSHVAKIEGRDLVGKKVETIGGRDVMVLPATFINPDFGTGIVHSVPSESADDLIALYDIQRDEETCKRFGLDIEEVRKIKPIAVLNNPDLGDLPAKAMLDKYDVKSQKEKDKLEEIKKELYKHSYYNATYNSLYRDYFEKDLEGLKVEDGKKYIQDELVKLGKAAPFFQLTGPVTCRCLTKGTVKIVDDQWFMAYSDEDWKKLAHECLDGMKLYPEKARAQFNYVLDWLRNWACTREIGLGTRLPWDEKWLIESLSDSTIYMAYYTISHRIKDIDPEKVDDALFDYVFLGKGKKESLKVDARTADELKKEFEYWYPLDFRNSGKDLIQNHLSFLIFNHTAIFRKEHWPKGIAVNGWVTIDGQKMSKSLGNVILIRDMVEKYGPDASRFTALSGGEGMDDANWDSELVKSMKDKLPQLLDLAKEHYGKGEERMRSVDRWALSQMNAIVKDATSSMEDAMFRSALQKIYFDMQRMLKWYMRRTAGNPSRKVMDRFIEVQALMLSPFTPFICEEVWEAIGKTGFISMAEWPKYDEDEADLEAERLEEFVKTTIDDINAVLKLAKVEKPSKVTLFVSDKWKYSLYRKASKRLEETKDMSGLIREFTSDPEFRPHAKDIAPILQKLMKAGKVIVSSEQDAEYKSLSESKDFFEREFGVKFSILAAEESQNPKARQAQPGKAAILVE